MILAGLVEVDGRREDKAGTAVPDDAEIARRGASASLRVPRRAQARGRARPLRARSVREGLPRRRRLDGRLHGLLAAARRRARLRGGRRLRPARREAARAIRACSCGRRSMPGRSRRGKFRRTWIWPPSTCRSSRCGSFLPAVAALVAGGGAIVVLVKPQFEAGPARGAAGRRRQVGRDATARRRRDRSGGPEPRAGGSRRRCRPPSAEPAATRSFCSDFV